jgi:hypothetical protein
VVTAQPAFKPTNVLFVPVLAPTAAPALQPKPELLTPVNAQRENVGAHFIPRAQVASAVSTHVLPPTVRALNVLAAELTSNSPFAVNAEQETYGKPVHAIHSRPLAQALFADKREPFAPTANVEIVLAAEAVIRAPLAVKAL